MPGGPIPVYGPWKPTGRKRPAIRWGLFVTLEIEECRKTGSALYEIEWIGEEFRWRYARPRDLHVLFAIQAEGVGP